ncbi:helix-turn-helix transcriptional regulator [Mesorhizobium sp. IMUNJ 23232]|uniref:helix-turn-helix transcriptional regulator n=1 Tax=Mesorhizobium sp. IMUNJ 23232 TaxID=3376064 RepID=UPI003794089E
MHKLLTLDLREVQRELLRKNFVRSSEALGPTETIFRTKEHGYRRIDDSILLHVLNFEAGRPYSLDMARRGLVCIQIIIKGTYSRWLNNRADLVNSASIQISNMPRATSETEAGMTLRGVLIACERQYMLDHLGLNVDCVPAAYRPIFLSETGMAETLKLPTSPSAISIADQLISCELAEPLKTLYIKAKTIELICEIVSRINMLSAHRPCRVQSTDGKSQAIEAAAAIYRREMFRPPTIEQLAFRVGLNRNDLTDGFREIFGTTPHSYGMMIRMEQAQNLLRNGGLSISEVARRVGYEGYSSFSRAYQAHYGYGPSLSSEPEL